MKKLQWMFVAFLMIGCASMEKDCNSDPTNDNKSREILPARRDDNSSEVHAENELEHEAENDGLNPKEHDTVLQHVLAMIRDQTATNQRLDAKILELDTQNQLQGAKITYLEAQNQRLEAKVDDHEDKIYDLVTQNQLQEAKITNLEAQNQQLETKVNGHEDKICDLVTQNHLQEAKINHMEAQNQQLEAKLNGHEDKIYDLVTQDPLQEAKITNLEAQNQQLEAKVNGHEDMICELGEQNEQEEATVRELKTQNQQLQIEIDFLKENTQHLEALLDGFEAHNDQKARINDLEERNQQKTEKIAQFEGQIQILNAQNQALKAQNQPNEPANQVLEARVGQLNETIKQLQAEFIQIRENDDVLPSGDKSTKSVNGVQSVKQAFACNLDTINLSCANGGKINITSAQYAQYKKSCSDTCCPPHPEDCKESMDETAPGDWNMLKSACNNKTSCRFENPGDLLPSCEQPYLSSYAMVYYSCSKGDGTEPSAFTATIDRHHSYNYGDIVIFDVIITNIGNNYQARTSTYVCPRQGIYVFSLALFNHYAYYMQADLMCGGDKKLATARADKDDNDKNNQGSVTAVTECAAGEQVWVRSIGGTNWAYGYRNSNIFSGFLLQPI